jgi:hypothetical protein
MPRRYPGAAAGRIPRSSNPAVSAFPGRGRRVGLRIVLFEACSAFTRVAACTLARSPIRDPLIEGFSHFVTLHDCSDCFRLERIAGWGLHPLESAALSRRTPISVVRFRSQLRRPMPQSCPSVSDENLAHVPPIDLRSREVGGPRAYYMNENGVGMAPAPPLTSKVG